MGILFDSREMLSEAVQCLERIRNEKDAKEGDKSGAHKSSDPRSAQDDEQEMSEDTGSDDPEGEEESQATPEGEASQKQDTSGDTSGASKQDQESSSKEPENSDQQQDASASSGDPVTKDSQRRRLNLCQNHMRLGSLVSQMKDKKSCGIQRPSLCVLPS